MNSYICQWQRLDDLLAKLCPLWQVQAFECHQLPWQQIFPQLAQQVWQLKDDQLDAIDADQALLNTTLLTFLAQDADIEAEEFQLEVLSVKDELKPLLASECESHFSAHIKGRKWQQINAFVSAIELEGKQVHCQYETSVEQQGVSSLSVLEWCAGKGHLGRLMAKHSARSVTSIEWQQILCDEGQAFADKWHLPQRFVCADAFNLSESPLLQHQHAVALHACGDLHVELLRHAAIAHTQAVSISPCCYHLIQAKQYQPLSELAQQSRLQLSRQDLRLPLQQSVIASPTQQKLRHKEVAWRLGFDSLQRELTESDSYLPIPSMKQSQLSGNFTEFAFGRLALNRLL